MGLVPQHPAPRYKDKIRRKTEENSACTFIDYDCQTGGGFDGGVWVQFVFGKWSTGVWLVVWNMFYFSIYWE